METTMTCTNNDRLKTTKSSDCHGGLKLFFGHLQC
jgi:hypothetical protein